MRKIYVGNSNTSEFGDCFPAAPRQIGNLPGRTLWALAECAGKDTDLSRRRWAAELFKTALPTIEEFSSSRAWAFALLGLDGYCALGNGDAFADRMRRRFADRLVSMFSEIETRDWVWFENLLAYDNARLPQALIQTGLTIRTPSYVEVGLRSLRWLMSVQTAPAGYFRPVGTKRFGRLREKPAAFDQQPVEAAATISAFHAAWRVDHGAEWLAGATRAFDWFLGENDLQTTLINPDTGSCSDGLHPDRPNENKGAESVLSYLLGLVEIRQLKRAAAKVRTKPLSKLVRSDALAIAPQTASGAYLSQSQFLHRQTLFLRPDPAKVVVRPFKPATEPRDFNPTDRTRANHIVGRVLRLEIIYALRNALLELSAGAMSVLDAVDGSSTGT